MLISIFFVILVLVTSMTDFKTSLMSITSNSPLANSTSSLDDDEISEIKRSNLLRSLIAILMSCFLSSPSFES